MKRRNFILGLGAITVFPLAIARTMEQRSVMKVKIEKIDRSEDEWSRILTTEQFRILRKEGTEPPFTSPLNDEKRKGTYACVGCELPLFTSDMKFDSGTGWPSFYTSIEGHLETKTDFKLILPRTEYHCARCGGHHGHIFKDGPKPTGERWCNNGVALKFITEPT